MWKVTIVVLFILLKFQENEGANTEKTNFVVLLADDLGLSDIGCFGNKTIPLPQILIDYVMKELSLRIIYQLQPFVRQVELHS